MIAPAAFIAGAAERCRVNDEEVPANFGDVDKEYAAAHAGVAVTHRAARGLFRVTGADRATFLQGMLTNNVVGIEVGNGCRTLFLDNKGHVRGVLDLWAEADALIGGCDVGFIDAALPSLTRYILAADVQIVDLRAEESVLALLGARVDALVETLGAAIGDGTHAHRRIEIGGHEVRLARTPSLGVQGFELHVPAAAIDDVWAAIEAAAGETLTYVGWNVAEVLRIEAGVPRLGHEISGDQFPQELHLNGAVDYEKGCYLGQETVARIHYRGQVNRLLAVLEADQPLSEGSELLSSGRVVGQVTSAATSPRRGAVGLGFVRREEYESAATLDVPDDTAHATVIAAAVEA